MNDTVVTMKDGRVFCGPLWLWRPREGYLMLVLSDEDRLETGNPEARIFFRDVASAVTYGERVGVRPGGILLIADVDELARAREDGWDGT